jgi:hypothetical protein
MDIHPRGSIRDFYKNYTGILYRNDGLAALTAHPAPLAAQAGQGQNLDHVCNLE